MAAMPAGSAERPLRIALVAFSTECNSFAPELKLGDFQELCLLRDSELLLAARGRIGAVPGELSGFVAAAAHHPHYQLIPILAAVSESGGPVSEPVHAALTKEIVAGIAAAGPLDAVYLALHGAMLTRHEADIEGLLLARIRRAVGPKIPIVATLDLHGKVTPTMLRTATLLAYRTNPHVDQFERGGDALRLLSVELAGCRVDACLLHVPVIATASSTLSGAYADLVQQARAQIDDELVDISLLPGFSKGDHVYNRFSVVATVHGTRQRAERAALDFGEKVWQARDRFSDDVLTLSQGVAAAIGVATDSTRRPVCIADIGDNPGGGGSGATLFLLRSLIEVQCPNVLLGLLCDSDVVAQARALGEGRTGVVEFNRAAADPFARPWAVQVRVLRLGGGVCRGRRGCLLGRSLDLGPGCLLEVGGVTVAVASRRYQTLDPAQFELFGVDVGSFRCIVLKSRAHFRAGFDQWFAPEDILLVDAGGLTSVRLEQFEFRSLARPVYPLDPALQWRATAEQLTWRGVE
jgi:microcystin degradation protein MlrC